MSTDRSRRGKASASPTMPGNSPLPHSLAAARCRSAANGTSFTPISEAASHVRRDITRSGAKSKTVSVFVREISSPLPEGEGLGVRSRRGGVGVRSCRTPNHTPLSPRQRFETRDIGPASRGRLRVGRSFRRAPRFPTGDVTALIAMPISRRNAVAAGAGRSRRRSPPMKIVWSPAPVRDHLRQVIWARAPSIFNGR